MGELLFLNTPTQPELEFFEAAKLLAEAQVRFSQEFQLAKMEKGRSDRHAHEIATEVTGGELTKMEAVYEIARARLG